MVKQRELVFLRDIPDTGRIDHRPYKRQILRVGAPEYTGRLCVIGSKLKEDQLSELFGL